MRVRRTEELIELDLEEAESAIVRELVGHVRDLLQDETEDDEVLAAGHSHPPVDPVLARLLPAGHRDDADVAAEYRELTEASLRADKCTAAEQVLAALPPEGGTVQLGREQADIWLRALNDVRLMMGVELDVTEHSEPPRRVRSQRDVRLSVYFWLTHLQDSLVEAVLR